MRRALLALLAVGATATACDSPGVDPITALPRALTTAETDLIAADNQFAFKLLRAVAAEESGANLFISPLSVGMALGLAYNGAAGATQDAMRETLELAGLTESEINASYRSLIDLLRGLDPTVEFVIANSVWYRQDLPLLPAYLDLARTFFDAEVAALDFGSPNAVTTINAWVNTQTRGRITQIVEPPIPGDALAYLINAIYFKGDWTYQFDRGNTAPAPFQLADGTTRQVATMRSTEPIPIRYARVGTVTVGELAYGGDAYRMTIVVPDDPSDLRTLAANLTAGQWDAWLAAVDTLSLLVHLPRFQLSYERSLKDDLAALGMAIAFCDDPAQNFDFTRMFAGPERACITQVRHKTFVDVNEEGTEAAAVTSVEIGVTSAPPMFLVDRPFLFAIREALSGTILFVGAIGDPPA
ncbi:MAG: serpin family protein [Gemmatimonadota bacterium]|nr:serpin family protein [Gemmatimonadota bacterium]